MILQKIAQATKLRIEQAKKALPLEQLKKSIPSSNTPFAFEKALQKKEIAFICEIKKASPSKGIIAEDFPYVKIAQDYQNAGASAISVLTEPDFFLGSSEYLSEIKKAVSIPLLRKDFILDEYQIYESAAIGADAILLICALHTTETMKNFINIADSLGLSCLVEAHDAAEIFSAVQAGARIIGVNNRDLQTFQVDIHNSIRLRPLVPTGILFVSESGIGTHADIQALQEIGASAVLIGETLMRASNKKRELNILRYGHD